MAATLAVDIIWATFGSILATFLIEHFATFLIEHLVTLMVDIEEEEEPSQNML